jgi:hypothetical protein
MNNDFAYIDDYGFLGNECALQPLNKAFQTKRMRLYVKEVIAHQQPKSAGCTIQIGVCTYLKRTETEQLNRDAVFLGLVPYQLSFVRERVCGCMVTILLETLM